MSVARRFAEIMKPAVDLIYPPRCPICGDAIGEQNGLCVACWSSLAIPHAPLCDSCGRPIPETLSGANVQCAPCIADPPIHDGIFAATYYNDASRKLILAFKHGRRIALSRMLARLMVARLPELAGQWLFIPVPLHRLRLWHRGFNQAALLAGECAKLGGQRLIVDGLVRKKRTRSLGGLGRKARERTLAGAIGVNATRRNLLKGTNIVLVDDVLTSGATSEACVKALKRAGASNVVICCFARVMTDARLEHAGQGLDTI